MKSAKPAVIDVPTKKQALMVARAALRNMASSYCPEFRGDLADSVSQQWTFVKARPYHPTECPCRPCRASIRIDRPILSSLQRSFSTDPEIIERLARYIVESAQRAHEEAERKRLAAGGADRPLGGDA